MPRFSFAFEPRYRLVDRAFGVTPASTWVELTDDTFEARFGPWRHSSRPEVGSRR